MEHRGRSSGHFLFACLQHLHPLKDLAFFPCAIAFVIFTLVGDVRDSGPWPSLLYYSAAWTGVKSGLV
jgi:hypothetical protein